MNLKDKLIDLQEFCDLHGLPSEQRFVVDRKYKGLGLKTIDAWFDIISANFSVQRFLRVEQTAPNKTEHLLVQPVLEENKEDLVVDIVVDEIIKEKETTKKQVKTK